MGTSHMTSRVYVVGKNKTQVFFYNCFRGFLLISINCRTVILVVGIREYLVSTYM